MTRSAFRVAALAAVVVGGAWLAAPPQAVAQATCRAKCVEEENACLARTYNKGQCGSRAQTCLAKCK